MPRLDTETPPIDTPTRMKSSAKSRRSATTETRQERHYGPDVDRLGTDWSDCIDRRDTSYWERQRVNYETRFCLWNNQSWDGRKWKRNDGKRVFPWIGASDARVMLTDHYVNVDVAMLMLAWTTQRILVKPTAPARGAVQAFQLTQLLRWQLYEDMEEAECEAEYLAHLFLERGAGAMAVFWDQQHQLTRDRIELAQLQQAAQIAEQQIARGSDADAVRFQAALPQLIMDPEREGDVVGVIGQMLDREDGPTIMTPERLRKVVRDLRKTGVAEFPRATVVKDRPSIRTLAWNEDVFLPPECADVQRSRVVFLRETLTETDLEDRVRGMDYDENWVDEVIESQRGVMAFNPSERAATRARTWGRGLPLTKNLFEVITAYRRLYDDDGIPGIYTTVFSPGMLHGAKSSRREDQCVGKHELMDYAHGKYPIVPFTLEQRSRLIDDSRGYGERAHTLQAQIKKQWDARIDRTDVATLPPSHHPPGEEPDAWGPGVQIPTLQADRFGYFDIPKYDAGSKEIEETVRRFADEYFGRRMEGGDAVDSNNLRQNMIRGWLRGWKGVCTQILQLDQQYLPDEVYARVIGSAQGRGLRVTREEIQGQFNVSLSFSVRNQDGEYVKELIGMMVQVINLDVSGRIDRDEALAAAMELIDPGYAERLLKPADEAALQQIDDEKGVLSKLLLGIPVDVRGDEAFALRKQTLTQTIQNSPTVQGLIRVNPQAAKLVQTRLQQLDFNIQQKMVNPEIGRRLGSQPMEKVGAGAGLASGPQQGAA